MKKTVKWLAAISITVFVIAWVSMGLKLLDNNYLITTEAYIGLISIVVCLLSILYVKFTTRCPHCGRTKQSLGKYCPYCGGEMCE